LQKLKRPTINLMVKSSSPPLSINSLTPHRLFRLAVYFLLPLLLLYFICTHKVNKSILCYFLCYTSMWREPKTVNLSLIDSQEEDSTFLVKSLYINLTKKDVKMAFQFFRTLKSLQVSYFFFKIIGAILQ